jgi:hypothetical protein
VLKESQITPQSASVAAALLLPPPLPLLHSTALCCIWLQRQVWEPSMQLLLLPPLLLLLQG